MRIAIVNLTCGALSGGYRKYLQNVLPRFDAMEDIEAILCVLSRGVALLMDAPLKKVSYALCSRYNILSIRHDPSLQKALQDFAPDIIFIPTERHFAFQDVPVVCMLQNMLPMVPFKHPNTKEYILHAGVRAVARIAMNRADGIIAVSEFAARHLTACWHIPEEKVHVVYHGVTEEKETCFPERIERQYDRKFLFTAGAIEAYRGLEDIIRAMTDPIMTARRLNLLIAGTARSGMKSYEDSLRKLVSSLGLEKSVHWLGQLNQHEMAWCYKNAKAFVMTSRIEACPNTALEAMVYGCPIVSTDAAPMPEMFGDTALYYSPGDINGLVMQLRRILSATPKQEIEMKRTSKERSKKFTWDITAERTLDALKHTIKLLRLKT